MFKVLKMQFREHFGWPVMEISNLIIYKKPSNEKNKYVRNASMSQLTRQPETHYLISNSAYMKKYSVHVQ